MPTLVQRQKKKKIRIRRSIKIFKWGLVRCWGIKGKIFKPTHYQCPHKRGIVQRIRIRSPKKPNSARRKTVRCILPSNKLKLQVGIQCEGHNLQKWSHVLIRGGRRRDIPGVRYTAIRGGYDLNPPAYRRTERSKYGLKNLKVI